MMFFTTRSPPTKSPGFLKLLLSRNSVCVCMFCVCACMFVCVHACLCVCQLMPSNGSIISVLTILENVEDHLMYI